MSHKCSYSYYQSNLQCTTTFPGYNYPTSTHFNDAFTAGTPTTTRPFLGQALKTYNVYVIYYGNKWTIKQISYINTFLQNVGSSAWYHSMYGNTSPTTNLIKLAGTRMVNHTSTSMYGITYVDSNTGATHAEPFAHGSAILNMMFADTTWTNGVPASQMFTNYAYLQNNPIYIFLQSGEKQHLMPYWYDNYCGSHFEHTCPATSSGGYYDDRGCNYNSANTIGFAHLPFIFSYLPTSVTDPNYLYGCNPYVTLYNVPYNSVSGDTELDSLVDTLAHELIETTSGFQIGNQCLGDYNNGGTATTSVTIGGKGYLLQRNFNTKTNTCY